MLCLRLDGGQPFYRGVMDRDRGGGSDFFPVLVQQTRGQFGWVAPSRSDDRLPETFLPHFLLLEASGSKLEMVTATSEMERVREGPCDGPLVRSNLREF
jgi:hypothetical protein